jgi:hypothetical protein
LTGSCEKRGLLATEAKRKNEAMIAGATSLWPSRGGRMAKLAGHRYQVMHAPFCADAVAAITSGGGRNRVRIFLYMPFCPA